VSRVPFTLHVPLVSFVTISSYNAQEKNDELEELRCLVNEPRTVVNQVVEAQNSTGEYASNLSTRSKDPATVRTQSIIACWIIKSTR